MPSEKIIGKVEFDVERYGSEKKYVYLGKDVMYGLTIRLVPSHSISDQREFTRPFRA
jgi:hypothetical protein